MLLTEQEIDDLSREMVKGCKSVNWLAKKIESDVLAKLKEQEPFAYFSINDYGAWEETSDSTAHALYEHPLPPDDVVRVAELETLLSSSTKKQVELTAERDELLAAAVMAVEMIEYNKHERRHVRWKLNDAIASVKEKA